MAEPLKSLNFSAEKFSIFLVDDEPANRVALRAALNQGPEEAQSGEEALVPRVGVSFAYVNKIKSGKPDFGEYPSEGLIHKLAVELDADEDELLLLAPKIPEAIHRLFERPDAFRAIDRLDARLLSVIQSDVRSLRRTKSRDTA